MTVDYGNNQVDANFKHRNFSYGNDSTVQLRMVVFQVHLFVV